MKTLVSILLILSAATTILAQAPQSIPYQAVVRSTDGSTMANAAVTITFKIHDNNATGTVVYEETHATTTNALGLVSLNVGGGTAVTGTFSGIQWGTGSKFLHVLMNAGSGVVDLGTQQMMSVPYALYAEEVPVRVSVTGDSLFIGDQVSIVPGVSAANPVSLSNYGSVLLPGNTTCTSEFISVSGCQGEDSLLYNGKYYELVEIGGQCWFAENLATTQYADGANIPNTTGGAAWGSLTTPAYCWYNNNASLIASYLGGEMGALYNAYAVSTGNLCPTDWHVPSDCEWMYLESSLGLLVVEQNTIGWRGTSIGLGGQQPMWVLQIHPVLVQYRREIGWERRALHFQASTTTVIGGPQRLMMPVIIGPVMRPIALRVLTDLTSPNERDTVYAA